MNRSISWPSPGSRSSPAARVPQKVGQPVSPPIIDGSGSDDRGDEGPVRSSPPGPKLPSSGTPSAFSGHILHVIAILPGDTPASPIHGALAGHQPVSAGASLQAGPCTQVRIGGTVQASWARYPQSRSPAPPTLPGGTIPAGNSRVHDLPQVAPASGSLDPTRHEPRVGLHGERAEISCNPSRIQQDGPAWGRCYQGRMVSCSLSDIQQVVPTWGRCQVAPRRCRLTASHRHFRDLRLFRSGHTLPAAPVPRAPWLRVWLEDLPARCPPFSKTCVCCGRPLSRAAAGGRGVRLRPRLQARRQRRAPQRRHRLQDRLQRRAPPRRPHLQDRRQRRAPQPRLRRWGGGSPRSGRSATPGPAA